CCLTGNHKSHARRALFRIRWRRGPASHSLHRESGTASCRVQMSAHADTCMQDTDHCSGAAGSARLSRMSSVRSTPCAGPHLDGDEHESLRGVPTLPALRAALAHARGRDWPPDAVLVTGDLVQDDPGGYPHFRRMFGALGVPVLCLPGNHDEPQAMRRELAGKPFALGGFVDLGRWRIVLLDSCLPGAASGALGAEALAHLEP